MQKKITKISILLICFVILTGQFSLWLVEKKIEFKYGVDNISVKELNEILKSEEASNYILFDTRQKEEYDVSYIPGAMLVDPEMQSVQFIKSHGPIISGKHLIFYCSVGERSSIFIERVKESSLKAGAESLANLRGGIFRWYNEQMPVVDDKGSAEEIHPYDEEWGKLVKDRD